jgi:hypothetical protein
MAPAQAEGATPSGGEALLAVWPPVQLYTRGLTPPNADFALSASSAAKRVTLNPGDAFTVYAMSKTNPPPTLKVRLIPTVRKVCQVIGDSDAIGVIEQPLTLEPPWLHPGASYPINVAAFPWNSCNPGSFLTQIELAVKAQALDETTGDRSETRAATFVYLPWRQVAQAQVRVNESDQWVSTGLTVQRDDRLEITAVWGGDGDQSPDQTIWAGVWFTGRNGPPGWMEAAPHADPPYPLPGANKYSLIGNLGDGANGPKFQVARSSTDLTFTAIPSMSWPEYGWPWFNLLLRTNDNVAGNGNGAFTANITLFRHL